MRVDAGECPYGDGDPMAVDASVHVDMAKQEERAAQWDCLSREERADLMAQAYVYWVLALESLLRWTRGEEE